jgi:hypothetical protein
MSRGDCLLRSSIRRVVVSAALFTPQSAQQLAHKSAGTCRTWSRLATWCRGTPRRSSTGGTVMPMMGFAISPVWRVDGGRAGRPRASAICFEERDKPQPPQPPLQPRQPPQQHPQPPGAPKPGQDLAVHVAKAQIRTPLFINPAALERPRERRGARVADLVAPQAAARR